MWKLKEEKCKEEFQEIVKSYVPADELKSVEEEWGRFRTTMVEAAERVCGRTSNRKRWKETLWWNDRVKEEIAKKNKAFRTWFQQRTEETRKEYTEKKKVAKRVVAEEKRKWMEEWTKMMERDSEGNKKILYGMVRAKKRGTMENVRMINKEGREVEDPQELKEMWREYFEELLNPNVNGEEENEELGGIEEREKDLTWTEVEEALMAMKG